MIITQLFAHMEKEPVYTVGNSIEPGEEIGLMGSTGLSTGAHVHIGNALGVQKKLWHLEQCETGEITPVPRQLNYHLDSAFFRADLKITTYYCDPDYQKVWGKVHYGYDLSTTKEWPWPFYWNRSKPGLITCKGWDKGYGWYILISLDTEG